MSALYNFLQRNQIKKTNPLPIVHSTEAYYLKKIVESGRIEPRPCNVFVGEKLTYFFVGRAAYKKESRIDAEYWELPSSIVFEFDISDAKRIYPFDTGAFKNKRYPSFISMMDMNEFEVSPDSESPHKLIGTFFGSSRSYYRLNARSQESFERAFDLDVLDEEMKALHKLIVSKDQNIDDRRFSIEIQYSSEILLENRRPIAVVIPEIYLENGDYIEKIQSIGAEIITYPIYPLRRDYYYAMIYERLENFYQSRGCFSV